MIENDNIPTGLPFKNLVYSFNDPNSKCKPGQKGELIVGGEQVMIGYTKQNSDKIVFSNENKSFYKTGDLFEYKSDGYFYYQGRIDSEVKILGNRINLESLRTFCIKNLDIEDIIFIEKNDQIICFVKGMNCEDFEIKNCLLNSFPSYVIPKEINKINNFPLNKNGKIDQNKLRSI